MLTEAQPSAWEAIVAKRPPCKHLKLEDFPEFSKGAKPPRRIYGWTFDDSYMLALAARRGLSFKPHRTIRHLFGGRETVKFSELTEDHFRDEELIHSLERIARSKVLVYFAGQTGTSLKVETAISPERKSVVVVWTNYDMHRKHRLYDTFHMGVRKGGWKMMKEFLQEAMNEGLPAGVEPSEPMWWWSKGRPVSVIRSPSLCAVTDECFVALRPNRS